jgi:uncharacterized protein (TIGR03032 family)
MRLDHPFIQLPLRFDAALLAAEVGRIDAGAWRPHPQGHPGNDALPLVSAHGDPTDDAAKGPMRPTPHLQRCPALRQVLAALGTVIGRARLMRLAGHAEATPHVDTHYYWGERARVHVPLVTDPSVRFVCGEDSTHMAAGECWIFDTWRKHNVLNPRDAARIHLVVDTVGSARFWSLVDAGRAASAPALPPGGLTAIGFDPGADPVLEFESFNLPAVMSPWEIERWLERLAAEHDAEVDRAAGDALAAAATRLRREWRALWARHADGAAGHAAYAALLQGFDGALVALGTRARLRNGVPLLEAARQLVVRAALDRHDQPAPAAAPVDVRTAAVAAAPAGESATSPASTPPTAAPVDPFAAPVFIVSPPRSGSTLLFETLARSPDVLTIGGESHAVIEAVPGLHPRERGFESNRLYARDATPAVVAALRRGFAARWHDRDGHRPAGERAWQLLEKTPKNALRVGFLADAFPGARFVYLYRDAREAVSSMLDGWRSGRFVTYPELPGWSGAPWSFLLTPGWREWNGKPLAEIVARQWSACTRALLDDLDALDPERWCVTSYDRLVVEPQTEIERLCAFLGLRWDQTLHPPLPASRHTLSSPAPDKWKRNAAELEPVMPLIAAEANRAHAIFARPPATRRPAAARARAAASGPAPVTAAATPSWSFASVHAGGLQPLLHRLGATLAVTTYQSGRLILVRDAGGQLNTHLRAFPSPMGLARRGGRLALGTQRSVWWFNDHQALAPVVDPARAHDACFVPWREQLTGDVRVHELAFAGEELWIVNTRFSCLATLDDRHSFVPRWRPRFVSALAAEDRCHLNGLAVHGERVAYVTALGASDAPQGWRERKADGGCVIDVASGELIAQGLSMPHSPRVHDGRLWVLESGKGTLATIDLADGRVETVATLPGFTRGLAFAGGHAFVGLSQVRETIFDGVPVAQRQHERECGVWLVDLASGRSAGFLRFDGDVREIFDVQLLEGLRHPDLLEPDHERVAGAFLLPDEALAEVVHPTATAPRAVRRRHFTL